MAEGTLGPRDRHTLGALRYAVNDEAASYLAIMRLFTAGMSGFLSDQSADDVCQRLAEVGVHLDRDLVDQRLSYLVEHGNLARSPRETEARSVREYLSNRARYQLTPRGELVHRQVEELLAHSDTAREVSSEMLPGILAGIEDLTAWASGGANVDGRDVARQIATLFAQFEILVASTRQFYSYLNAVLTRFDLVRDEFIMFKSALVDYLQRFVDEISRHMPQIADRLLALEPQIEALCAWANEGERLVGLDGNLARRATGLEPADWHSLRAWFVGTPGRRSDAENVRRLATDAMRSLLTNLRRLAAGADRQQSRYGDLVLLGAWFDAADDDRCHAIWAAAFGLHSARHLAFPADALGDPVPSTSSWWQAPVAQVPLGLRTHGDRLPGGRANPRVDFSAAKIARIAERAQQQERRAAAARELGSHAGHLGEVHLSDEARAIFLEIFSSVVSQHGRPLSAGGSAHAMLRVGGLELRLDVVAAPGRMVSLHGPTGVLTLQDLSVALMLVGTNAGAMDERMPA